MKLLNYHKSAAIYPAVAANLQKQLYILFKPNHK